MEFKKYIIAILALPVLVACGADSAILEDVQNVSENSNFVMVTKAQFDLGKMELGTFSERSFQGVIKTTGMLDVPPENQSTVSAYFGGYVKQLSLLQGQKVSRGKTLFTLESPEYIQVQQDYLESKSQLVYLKSDYERQKDLAASNVSSQKTFLKAESEYKVMSAKCASLKRKLQLMNINPASVSETNLRTTIAVKAPISGYVTSVLATKGMFLNPSDIALTILNTDHMHVELNIFEKDLAKVSIGQQVTFRLQNDLTEHKATVHLINKAIDPQKRTIKVHCHLLNENDALNMTPGMYVEAEISASSNSSFALPVNAVISIEDKSFVLIKSKNSNDQYGFERVKVVVGQTDEGFVQIFNASDFKKGAEILIEGSFNLIQ